MEFVIILLILAVLGFFLWRSYANNKSQDPNRGKNPNPNAPTSSKRL